MLRSYEPERLPAWFISYRGALSPPLSLSLLGTYTCIYDEYRLARGQNSLSESRETFRDSRTAGVLQRERRCSIVSSAYFCSPLVRAARKIYFPRNKAGVYHDRCPRSRPCARDEILCTRGNRERVGENR